MLKYVLAAVLAVLVVGEEGPQVDPMPQLDDPGCDISGMRFNAYKGVYEQRMAKPCVVKTCTKEGKRGDYITCPSSYWDDSDCSKAGLERDRCYMEKFERAGTFPRCCPKWIKMCHGSTGYDATKVRKVSEEVMKKCFPQEDVLPWAPGY